MEVIMSRVKSPLWAITTVAALPFLASAASAAEVRLGVVGDLNVATASLDGEESVGIDTSSLARWGGGLRADIEVTPHLTVSLSPMVLGKGFETDIPPGVEDVRHGTNKLTYVEVPLDVRYAFGDGDVRPYLFAGPRVGFLTSAKSTLEYVDGSEEEIDFKDDTKSVDFGLAGGAGLDVRLTDHSRGFIEALYAQGLTNFNDDPGAPNDTYKNHGFQVRAGLTFSLR
jgi:opacity protein-like surface antigen